MACLECDIYVTLRERKLRPTPPDLLSKSRFGAGEDLNHENMRLFGREKRSLRVTCPAGTGTHEHLSLFLIPLQTIPQEFLPALYPDQSLRSDGAL